MFTSQLIKISCQSCLSHLFRHFHLSDRHGLGAGEVEPHPVGGNEGSSLVNLRLEDLPEGVVEDVGAGVVLHDVLAPLFVELQVDGVADAEGSLDGAHVEDVASADLNVRDLELDGLIVGLDQESLVEDLTSLLGVEAGLVKQDTAFLAGFHLEMEVSKNIISMLINHTFCVTTYNLNPSAAS